MMARMSVENLEREDRVQAIGSAFLRVLLPVVVALVVGGAVLLVLGRDPIEYYGYVVQRGLFTWGGLQETATRMAPLLLIAAGLIVAFRAGIWNLGGDGQFLLAAVFTAALAPVLIGVLPKAVALLLCMTVSVLIAARGRCCRRS